MVDVATILDSNGLYQTHLPNGSKVTWRLLALKEFRAFQALANSGVSEYYLYDQVFDHCYIGIASLIDSDIPVGWCMSIGKLIYNLSGGAGQFKEELEMARINNPQDSIDGYMKRIVLRAFPSYTFEDIEGWTRPLLLQRFVVAEQILMENGSGYEMLQLKDILTPEQKARHAKRQQKAQGINFGQENASLQKATNMADGKDIWELDPSEFDKKMKIARHMNRHRA